VVRLAWRLPPGREHTSAPAMTSFQTSALKVAAWLAVPLLWSSELLVTWNRSSAPSWASSDIVPLMLAIVYLPLLWRRRRPLATMLLMVVGSSAIAVIVPEFVPLFCVWLALYNAAAHCPRRAALYGLAAAFLPTLLSIASEVRAATPATRLNAFIVPALASTMVNLGVFAIGRWVQWSIAQRHRVAVFAAEQAAADERQRIARDLHDVVAHAVSLMVLQAAGAERILHADPARASTALRNVGDIGHQAVIELQRMLGLLTQEQPSRPGVPPQGLKDITGLIDNAKASGFTVELIMDEVRRPLDPGTDLSAYRIVQEALTNAIKYADQRRPIQVTVSARTDAVEIRIVNRRSDVPSNSAHLLSSGYGLRGMHERARFVGGECHALPTPDGRFVVKAILPTAQVIQTEKSGPVKLHKGFATMKKGAHGP
jgi:signal transduction histidine kinase